jgi:hypothetical protein
LSVHRRRLGTPSETEIEIGVIMGIEIVEVIVIDDEKFLHQDQIERAVVMVVVRL